MTDVERCSRTIDSLVLCALEEQSPKDLIVTCIGGQW